MITEFPHTFDECMALDGVEIVDAHHLSKHSHRFAAHIFVPRLGVKSFTNLSSIHLSQHFDLDHLRIQEEFIPLKPSSPGHSFVECMARGAKIVDGHQTPSGRFAIHVEMGHGQRKSFSNLSAEKIVPYHSVSDWQTNRN